MQKKLTMGVRLWDLLVEKGINAQKLSDDTGIPKATISEIISDKDKNFGYKTIVKIAEHLNVSVDYLVGTAELPTKDYNKKFINQYTGLTEKSIELLNKAKKIYDLYDKLQYTDYDAFAENEDAYIKSGNLFLLINSLLEFDQIHYISENFSSACFYQPLEEISEQYDKFLKYGIANSKNEEKFFLKMKKIGWESKEYDLDERHENTETVDFNLFALNGRFKDLVEEIGKKNYLNVIEEHYLNKK